VKGLSSPLTLLQKNIFFLCRRCKLCFLLPCSSLFTLGVRVLVCRCMEQPTRSSARFNGLHWSLLQAGKSLSFVM
jgi:hypothetical protein